MQDSASRDPLPKGEKELCILIKTLVTPDACYRNNGHLQQLHSARVQLSEPPREEAPKLLAQEAFTSALTRCAYVTHHAIRKCVRRGAARRGAVPLRPIKECDIAIRLFFLLSRTLWSLFRGFDAMERPFGVSFKDFKEDPREPGKAIYQIRKALCLSWAPRRWNADWVDCVAPRRVVSRYHARTAVSAARTADDSDSPRRRGATPLDVGQVHTRRPGSRRRNAQWAAAVEEEEEGGSGEEEEEEVEEETEEEEGVEEEEEKEEEKEERRGKRGGGGGGGGGGAFSTVGALRQYQVTRTPAHENFPWPVRAATPRHRLLPHAVAPGCGRTSWTRSSERGEGEEGRGEEELGGEACYTYPVRMSFVLLRVTMGRGAAEQSAEKAARPAAGAPVRPRAAAPRCGSREEGSRGRNPCQTTRCVLTATLRWSSHVVRYGEF
ncbi:Protein of unknown function [Gryllus bimaculatus]|nr:Protein of unknown function [Gryllus bimaculatus]